MMALESGVVSGLDSNLEAEQGDPTDFDVVMDQVQLTI